MVTIWNPEHTEIAEADMLARVEAMTFCGRTPFAKESVDLLSAISKAILSSKEGRSQAQYVALGYWLRPAALERVIAEYQTKSLHRSYQLVPRGITLHLPPTNVDTIFVYSWAAALLAGNCNIVRLPSTINANTEWLVKLIATVIKEKDECARQIFCSYPHTGGLNDALSAYCDLRMIWGGDEKVKSVSTTPIRPDGLSIGFSDRKSLALIDTPTYRAASDAQRDDLVHRFFNDIYWFNQMGCGSPRILFWIGSPKELALDFFGRLLSHVKIKQHRTEIGAAISKFTTMNAALASGIAENACHLDNALDVYTALDAKRALDFNVGGGLIGQMTIENAGDIARHVDRRTQTITYFGLSPESLNDLASKISTRGGYRIVPVGQALQFDIKWDGIDLIELSTRTICIH